MDDSPLTVLARDAAANQPTPPCEPPIAPPTRDDPVPTAPADRPISLDSGRVVEPGESGQPDTALKTGVAYFPAREQTSHAGGDWADNIAAGTPHPPHTRDAASTGAPAPRIPSGADITGPRTGASTTLVVGDVMGHGSAFAGHTHHARTTLATALRHRTPAAALHLLDTQWPHGSRRAATFVTVCVVAVAPLELPTGDDYRDRDTCGSWLEPAHWWQLRWSNAGHPAPLLLTPAGVVTTLTHGSNDLPIGINPTRPRRDYTTIVPAGTTLLMFTDGLTEQRRTTDPDGLTHLTELATTITTADRRTPSTVAHRLLNSRAPLLDTGDEATLLVAHLDAA